MTYIEKNPSRQNRRNGLWHKKKQIRRLQTLRDNLRDKSHEKEYIPLEKPIWSGWDISIGLSHEAKFRKDADDLQKIADVLGNRSVFTKNVKLVRFIRRNGFTLDSYRHFYKEYWFSYYDLGNRHIKFHEYNNLPENLKHWFSPDKMYKYSTDERPYYTTRWSFPWYAFRLYISKSFNTHKVVYDTVAQSEYEKLDGDLYVWDSKTWGRYSYRDSFVKRNKTAYKTSLRKIVTYQYSPEEIIDEYSQIFRGTNNQRDYGWS